MATEEELLIAGAILPAVSDLSTRVAITPTRESAADTFDARVMQLERLWNEGDTVRRAVREHIAFAAGDQISTTPPMPHEPASHQARKPRFAPNFLGYTLDQFSYLYNEDPVRRIDGQDRWREILWDYGVGLDAIMDDAQPGVRLVGTELAYVMPSFGDGPQDLAKSWSDDAKPDGLLVFLLELDRWVAVTHPTDPRFIGAVAILFDVVTTTKTEHGHSVHTTTQIHHYWDGEYFAVLHNWSVVQKERHSLGEPPVWPAKSVIAPRSIYGSPLGGVDLLPNLRSINSIFEELLNTARMQRGQPTASGNNDPEGGWMLAPDVVVRVESGESFNIVSNGADLAGMLNSLREALDRYVQCVGLPRNTFRIADQLPPSAVSILASRAELADDRRKQRRVWRETERGIHRVGAKVWEAWTGESLSADLEITYPETPVLLTHSETLAEVKLKLDEGLISRQEATRQLDPERSESQIDEMLEEADGELQERLRAKAIVAGHAADLDGESAPDDESSEGEPTTPAADGEDIQRQALNGAQVTALQGMLLAVALGQIDPVAARIAIANAFPAIPPTDVAAMVAAAESTPRAPAEVVGDE